MSGVGEERWRKNALYDIMDGKNGKLITMLEQDPELKTWKCKQAGDECFGFSLLHGAVRFGNHEALSLLLANGATDITSLGKGGKTPFDMAIMASEPRMVAAMLDCATAGTSKMPNLDKALRDAETQLEAANRSGSKVEDANQTRDLVLKLIQEAERKRRAEEEAAAAAAAEAQRLLEEEIARAGKAAAEAAAAAAARRAKVKAAARAAAATARLEREARLREEDRRQREAEEEEEEMRRNARDARTQMIHFNGLIENSMLKKGIGREAPIIVIRMRPASAKEFADDPENMLGDASGAKFDEGSRHEPGLNQQYSLGDSKERRAFSCNSMHRDRDAIYGTEDAQYVDTDQLNSYLEVGGTIIDSMTKGTNSTVIVCGSRNAGKSYILGRPFHDQPYERDEFNPQKSKWTSGNLVKSDDSGLVERTGRDLMSYRTVLQANEPSAKLFVVMTSFVIYQEKMYDVLAKSRDAVLKSCSSLKVVGQEVKAGAEGRGIFVQGLTQRSIAQEGPAKAKGGKEKSVRGWLMKADANRRNLAKDLKAGDKGLRRACCVTMFEILQLSESKPAEVAKGRGRASREPVGKGGTEKQMLYSSVTFVDLPGAVKQPADDPTKKKEDVSITKMQQSLSNCVDMLSQQLQQRNQASGKKGKGKKLVIPWRNSKLTMLLRDKIGGNNLTIMIGALSPARAELENSKRTLDFLRICGSLWQLPIEEREANISLVPELSAKEKKAREEEKARKKAAKEAIIKERKEKRDRGEKIYDEETGELLLDDDDLEDVEGGLASLLEDPDAIQSTIESVGGDVSADVWEENPRIKAHSEQRKVSMAELPEHALVETLLDSFPAGGRFRKRMDSLDARRKDLLKRLRQLEMTHGQLLAELKSAEQVYLEFDSTPGQEKIALRSKLNKLLFAGKPKMLKSRSKFLNAFQEQGENAARAWNDSQFEVIQERCDALLKTQTELGACRRQLVPLLKEMRDVVGEQRFEVFDEHAKSPDESHEIELQDLGLLASQIEAELELVSSPASSELIDPTIGYSKAFGKELHVAVNAALVGLAPASRHPSMLSKLRSVANFVSQSSRPGDDDESEMSEEMRERRREALKQEASFIAAFIEPSTASQQELQHPNLVLTTSETELLRLAQGIADAIRAILRRTQAQKEEDMRINEERLQWLRAMQARTADEDRVRRQALEASRTRRSTPLAAGEWHTVFARPSDGATFSWGSGSGVGDGVRRLGLLGQGQTSGPCVCRPMSLSGLDGVRVREVAAGTMHTLLVDTSGAVWSCGVGRFGALGHGNLADLTWPQRIESLEKVRADQVAAGASHSMVLSSEGQVYTFGWGASGRLGHGDVAAQREPVRVAALLGVRICQVSGGATHSLAVGDAGELYAWGGGSHGRLGLGTVENQPLPVQVPLPAEVRIWQASAGGSHSLAVSTDGALYSFGSGGHGQLGHGDAADRGEPKLVDALHGSPVRDASAGMAHSVVLTGAGRVLTFGCNDHGLLGHSDFKDLRMPTAVPGLSDVGVDVIATGAYHTVVLLSNGSLNSFGSNAFGQLASGARSDDGSSTPVAAAPLPF